MKLVYQNIEHILQFGDGCVNELIVENKKLFFEMVNNAQLQVEGQRGNFVLSIANRPVEFSKYADVIIQFAPFDVNKKALLTKLCYALEQKSLQAENYSQTRDILSKIENYLFQLAEDLPFEVECTKVTISNVIKAIGPEIDVGDKSTLEKLFAYMELIRELDRDRLFVMVNMRTYFSDREMNCFIESVCLHDFKVLLLENVAFSPLNNLKRFIIDDDLCEI